MVSVQWLRAVAVMMVIVFHVLLKAQILGLTTTSFSQGAAGVDLFFIISGFIMIYITTHTNFLALSFIKKRLLRIIPLYWILSTVATVVYFYNPSIVNSHNGETSLLSSFSLIPIEGKVMLLEVGWTLRYEFFFYFIFAISMFLFKNNARYCVLSILLISMTSLLNIDNFYIQYFTNPIILEFSFGIVSFYLLAKITRTIGFILLTLGILLWFTFSAYGYGLQNRVIYYGVPMLFIFIGTLSFESIIKNSKAYTSRIFSYIGDASYSLYLSHTFTIAAVAKSHSFFKEIVAPSLFTPVAIIASVLAGIICYEWIEKPITKLVKNFNFSAGAINAS